jgi:hypothetical protein
VYGISFLRSYANSLFMAFDQKPKEKHPPTVEHRNPASKKEHQTNEDVSKNPNPRANENLKDKDPKPGNTNQVGSEITDGEDG